MAIWGRSLRRELGRAGHSRKRRYGNISFRFSDLAVSAPQTLLQACVETFVTFAHVWYSYFQTLSLLRTSFCHFCARLVLSLLRTSGTRISKRTQTVPPNGYRLSWTITSSHDGPIGRSTRGYILMMDQSDLWLI
eukprot:1195519-Prorocentrum_minimum.AAC.6